MRITFVTRKFGNVERNSHCDVLHITPIRVARLFLDCNGYLAIKAYILVYALIKMWLALMKQESVCSMYLIINKSCISYRI